MSNDIVPTKLDRITIGCDPEFFLKFKDMFVPAYITGISGSKKEPTKLNTGGAVQVDGMALEFNIPPVTNGKDFYDLTKETLFEIRKMVDKDLEFVFVPEATFPQVDFDATPAQYKELGCDPDYDAWANGLEKTPPEGSGNKPFRTAGGHLHFGWIDMGGMHDFDCRDPRHIYDCNYLIKGLEQSDYYFVEHERAIWSGRARLYGSVGSYRPKPYGVEWRTPSNMWLNYPKGTVQACMDSFIDVVNGMLNKRNIDLNREQLLKFTGKQSNASALVSGFYRGYTKHVPAHSSIPNLLKNVVVDDNVKVKNWTDTGSTIVKKTRKVA